MAQEQYGFFNSTENDPRNYDADDMAQAFGTLASTGVADGIDCLRVTANGTILRSRIGYGKAMINGYFYQLKDDGGGLLAFDHTAEESLNRIDRLALRLDLTARTVTAVKLIGIAASSPVAPALTRNDEIYEISLAQVRITAGATALIAADITDERDDDAVCGLIAPESLRRSFVLQTIHDVIDEETADAVRFSEQALSETEQEQARGNLAAQQRITATGLLKGDGNGAVTAAVSNTDYAPALRVYTRTITVDDWVGTEAPFTCTVSVTSLLAASNAIVGVRSDATTAQYLAAVEALLRVTAQADGSFTVSAEGVKPDRLIPIYLYILG